MANGSKGKWIAAIAVLLSVAVAALAVAFRRELEATWQVSRLDAADSATRQEAARRLAQLSWTPAAPVIVETLRSEGLDESRQYLVEALAQIDARSIEALGAQIAALPEARQLEIVGLLEASPESHRFAVGLVVAMLEDRETRSHSHPVSASALAQLCRLGPSGLAALAAWLGRHHRLGSTGAARSGRHASLAAEQLEEAGADLGIFAVTGLASEEMTVRIGTSVLLAEGASDAQFASLRPETRRELEAIAKARLRDERDPRQRALSLALLTRGGVGAEDLADVFSDSSTSVRRRLWELVIEEGDWNLESARLGLSDADAGIRLLVLTALTAGLDLVDGDLVDESVWTPPRELLLECFEDEASGVRARALRALEPLGIDEAAIGLGLLERQADWSFGVSVLSAVHRDSGETFAVRLRQVALDRERPQLVRAGALRALDRLVGSGTALRAALAELARDLHGAEAPAVAVIAGRIVEQRFREDGGAHVKPGPLASTMRVGDVEGRPGETVPIELHADIVDVVVRFDATLRTEGEVAQPLRLDPEGTWLGRLPAEERYVGLRRGHQGYPLGVHPWAGETPRWMSPAKDIVLARLVWSISDDALPGEYAIELAECHLTGAAGEVLSTECRDAVLRVLAPEFAQTRDAEEGDAENGDAKSGDAAEAAGDGAVYEEPAPGKSKAGEPVKATEPVVVGRRGDQVEVRWSDAVFGAGKVHVARPGKSPVELDARVGSWLDAQAETWPVPYTVSSRVDGARVEHSAWFFPDPKTYRFEVEEKRVEAGEKGVRVLVYGTNALPSQAYSFGFRATSDLVEITEVGVEGTDAATAETPLYQKHSIADRIVGAGILMDMVPPQDPHLPAGVGHTVLAVRLDISEQAKPGSTIPLVFGSFGTPEVANTFTVDFGKGAASVDAVLLDGLLLVGESLVPPLTEVSGTPAASGEPRRLEWRAPGGPDPGNPGRVEISRAGEQVADVDAKAGAWADTAPLPCPVRYHLRLRRGDLLSHPVTVTFHWPGAPPVVR